MPAGSATAARRAPTRARLALLVLALATAMVVARPARAAITVQLTPGTLSVAPNSDFDVKLRITTAGSPFNAFHAVIAYDPGMLTPVQISPLRNQLDSLVTGVCGSTFHKFRFGGGLDTIDVALLCNGVSITGPGALYRLRFHAGNVTGRTGLSFGPGLEFADGGVFVNPVQSSGAVIGIGVPVLDAGEFVVDESRAPVVSPNPAAGPRRIAFGRRLTESGTLRVLDTQGRCRFSRVLAAGESECEWSGRDAAGTPLAPGLYLAEVRSGEWRRVARIMQLR
ncbi:MAG: hypothetical protein U0704_01145 [Candidatus Eisenbacteria bacterium]